MIKQMFQVKPFSSDNPQHQSTTPDVENTEADSSSITPHQIKTCIGYARPRTVNVELISHLLCINDVARNHINHSWIYWSTAALHGLPLIAAMTKPMLHHSSHLAVVLLRALCIRPAPVSKIMKCGCVPMSSVKADTIHTSQSVSKSIPQK